MKAIADIIIKPLITEKATDSLAEKRYAFKVMKSATKPMVPAIIKRTLKSIVPRTFSMGKIPIKINTIPDAMAI